MINSTPQVKHLTVDPDKHRVHVPSPLRIASMLNAALSDLSREYRTEAISPQPNRLVADVDAPLKQDIFDLAQRQRVADIQHHCEANYLRRAVEIAERVLQPTTLPTTLHRIKPRCFDSFV